MFCAATWVLTSLPDMPVYIFQDSLDGAKEEPRL
jgi:hypothetical protein